MGDGGTGAKRGVDIRDNLACAVDGVERIDPQHETLQHAAKEYALSGGQRTEQAVLDLLQALFGVCPQL